MHDHEDGSIDPRRREHPSAGHRMVLLAGGRPSCGSAPRGGAGERPGVARGSARLRVVARDDDGFTLVELLVVVLMLVALVGIAVPTFVGQRDGAVQAAVQSELRTAAIALESYRAPCGDDDRCEGEGDLGDHPFGDDVRR